MDRKALQVHLYVDREKTELKTNYDNIYTAGLWYRSTLESLDKRQ